MRTRADLPDPSAYKKPFTLPKNSTFISGTDGSESDHKTLYTSHRVTQMKAVKVNMKKIVPFKTDFLLNEGACPSFLLRSVSL